MIKKHLTFLVALLSLTMYAQQNFGGLALYTVRDEMNKDAVKTLQAVADAGYSYVEAAGYKKGRFYGMSPEKFNKACEDVGLEPVSSHQGGLTYKNMDKMVAAVKEAGFKYFVLPVPPMDRYTKHDDGRRSMTDDDVKSTLELMNTLGKKCKDAGLMLLYHNHEFEFQKTPGGIVPLDFFLENTDPELVNFELDLYWVTKAGVDAISYFNKYPDRFKLWHVKDMDLNGRFAPVGSGTIDFGKILAEKDLSGMIYYYVEQDKTFDKEPLEVIKISHQGLKKFGFD